VYDHLSHFQSASGMPVSMLQKPYTKDSLGQKVKEMLANGLVRKEIN